MSKKVTIQLKTNNFSRLIALYILACILLFSAVSCGVYTFKDISIPPEIQTVKLNFFQNKARYINPQLAPKLNERFQQKIVTQTKLKRTTSDEADYVISGSISDYYVSTAGVSNQQVSTSNLNVGIHITLKNNKKPETKEYDVSKAFPFSGQKTLQEVENSITDEIVKGITDEIFNRLFSEW
jgi:Lipopolysaccharide-assembly